MAKQMKTVGKWKRKFLGIRKEKREAQYKSGYERLSKQRAYDKTTTGKAGRGVAKAFSALRQPQGIARSYYSRTAPVIIPRGYDEYGNPISARTVSKRTISGRSAGRSGRPSGTYDRRYAAYGGVYGYRKMLAAKLRAERIQMMREATVNPRQRAILSQVEVRDAAVRMNPERRTFPDSSGKINMSSFMQEVDDAAGIVP
jgi:hypothetical protein